MFKKTTDGIAVNVFAAFVPISFATAAAEIQIAALAAFVGKQPGRRDKMSF